LLVLHSVLSLGKNGLILVRQSLELDAGLPKFTRRVEKVGLEEIQKGHGLAGIRLEVRQDCAPAAVQFYRVLGP
jgi:hypothetical protein